ncbi:MAG: DUF2914 domain-containing protein [Kofleriaceae bacterium]
MKHSTMFALGLSLALSLSSTTTFAEEKAPIEAKPAPAVSEASAELKAGTGVEKRAIVGEATSFPAGTTVWVWSLVKNAEGSVKHVWKRDGKAVWTATLKIGSKKWSTSSRRKIPKAGSWEVEVQTLDGASLGTVAFTIN